MASEGINPEQMTEEQLRAAYEAEIKQVRVEHVLLENVVTLINLGMRRTGLMAGTEDERDPGQVALAIDSVRAVMPMVEAIASDQAPAIQDALSQLQIAFVQLGAGSGAPGAGGPGVGTPTDPGTPGPAGTPGPGPAGMPGSGPAGTPGPGEPGDGAQEPGQEPIKPGEPGPAQRSGRLWVPGQ